MNVKPKGSSTIPGDEATYVPDPCLIVTILREARSFMASLRELLPISSWCDKWLQELFKIEYRFGYLVLTVYNDKSIMQNDKKVVIIAMKVVRLIIKVVIWRCSMILRNRLKERRAALDVNQQEMGRLCGVSRQTISLIERGDYSPSVTLALTIAKVCGVTVEEVFYLQEEDNDGK